MFKFSKDDLKSLMTADNLNDGNNEDDKSPRNGRQITQLKYASEHKNDVPEKLNLLGIIEEDNQFFECYPKQSPSISVVNHVKNTKPASVPIKYQKVEDDMDKKNLTVVVETKSQELIQNSNVLSFEEQEKQQQPQQNKRLGKNYRLSFGKKISLTIKQYSCKMKRDLLIFGFGLFVGYSTKHLGGFKY
mmetsp:Transcript_18628/g.17938  ORF Transcript_18628/g.17938 Transcript_18628/m.17938 type:complete len:189 (-) Transcript_18628:26-592(-)